MSPADSPKAMYQPLGRDDGETHLALCSLQLCADLLQACVQRSELSFTHAHTVLAVGRHLAHTHM